MMKGAGRVKDNTMNGADRVKDNTTNGALRVRDVRQKTPILGLHHAKAVIQTRDRERDREASHANHSTSMSGPDLAPVKGTMMTMPAILTTGHIHGRTGTTRTMLGVQKDTMTTDKPTMVVVIMEQKTDRIPTQVSHDCSNIPEFDLD